MLRITGRIMLVVVGCSLIMAGAAMPITSPSPQVGVPLQGLTPSELDRFTRGKGVFSREFTAETGLGPFFNNTSCAKCHEDPAVGGAGAFGEDDVDTERHATAGEQPTCDELEAAGGPVFRQQTTGPDLPPIPALADVRVGVRSTPAVFGFGLIEAIPDSAILANQGRAGGRAATLPNGKLGRFGRKATDADLLTFIKGAFDKEQGVLVPRELSSADLALTVDFVRFLGPPSAPVGDRYGERMFYATGCATCHIPSFVTRSPIEALNRKIVYIYSDLLLHDMGEALADICKGVATRSEFRTEPLMGLRNRTRFLHDGRALSLESAIVQHGGQGAPATAAFLNLSRLDRYALLRYLRSL
jgi:CxxC motif-containing protein (DUF1111 family)